MRLHRSVRDGCPPRRSAGAAARPSGARRRDLAAERHRPHLPAAQTGIRNAHGHARRPRRWKRRIRRGPLRCRRSAAWHQASRSKCDRPSADRAAAGAATAIAEIGRAGTTTCDELSRPRAQMQLRIVRNRSSRQFHRRNRDRECCDRRSRREVRAARRSAPRAAHAWRDGDAAMARSRR